MNYLITGGAGFIGKNLVDYFAKTNKVFTLDIKESTFSKTKHFLDALDNEEKIYKILKKTKPDVILHFAGISRVTDKIDFFSYFSTNFLTTNTLLRGINRFSRPVTLFFASSVHVYGNVQHLVDENSPIHPSTPYGYSKYLAEEALKEGVNNNPHLSVIIGRLYNCIGPGQPLGFVASDLCYKIADLVKKSGHSLTVGSLKSFRRFLDVRDLAKILDIILQTKNRERFEIYNIAGKQELTIKDMMNILLKHVGISPNIETFEDEHSNLFQGLKINTEKLLKVVSDLDFTDINDTLVDMYKWTWEHFYEIS